MKSIKQLIQTWQACVKDNDLPHPPAYAGEDIVIQRFIEDSREVKAGDCFVARVRMKPDGTYYSNGNPFIEKAIANGATMVLAQVSAESLNLTIPDHVTYWQVPDTAVALTWLAGAWYNFPGQEMTVIGVTGTDGKTSVTNMLYDILAAAGKKTGMVSTIKAVIGDYEEPTGLHVSTPQAPDLQALLRRMADDGCTHVVLEATSYGLLEHRTDTAFYDVGVVTNITHEHFDYHVDYANYLAAKGRLFEMATHAAILNRDDESFDQLSAICQQRTLVYALDHPTPDDITASDVAFSAENTTFTIHTGDLTIPIDTQLVGKFNVYNMLAAAGAAHAIGIEPSAIKAGLDQIDVLSGRMERINAGQPFLTIVDFAHTPNALIKAIEAARGMTDGRIITVFGSAGRRDVAKRRLMAEVSADYADLTILTAEDPRQEPLADILQMMADGALSKGAVEGETFWRVNDRGRAIFQALALAKPEDLVLVCGKGHEQSMCFGVTEFPWDDRNATRAALDAFLNGRPMPDLGLPTF